MLGLPSSGLHSNGFSLVRRVVERTGLGWDDPAPFAPGGVPLAEALLVPTRIYVRTLLAALKRTQAIRALAHITGGGFVDNIPRVLPQGLGCTLDLGAIAVPPVFGWLATRGGLSAVEMVRTFNCGVGMAVVVKRDEAAAVAALLAELGEMPVRLGEIVRGAGVTIAGNLAL